jgi:hypothetical protein
LKGFFAIILLLINWHFSIAQKNLSTDTSDVVVRSFNNDELQEFKKDKEFYYDGYNDPSKGLWERFWEWSGGASVKLCELKMDVQQYGQY